MIRILHVLGNLECGGIQKWLLNIYRSIDRTQMQFDFLVHFSNRSFYDEEIEELGGKIYYFSVRDDFNFIKYRRDLYKFFLSHREYQIVHGHYAALGYIYLDIAQKCDVPIRIAHSHNAFYEKTLIGLGGHLLDRWFAQKATERIACSKEAGDYLYGNRSYRIQYNSILSEEYRYNCEIREQVRIEFGFEDRFVIGNVGRFSKQKNHLFLLKVFELLYKENKNARLLLCGDGKLKDKIERSVRKLACKDAVVFAGNRRDISRILQGIDVFVLPSLYEGNPVSVIEAQAAGLPCILSDRITKDVNVAMCIQYVSLGSSRKSIKEWVNAIQTKERFSRFNTQQMIVKAHMDSKHESVYLSNMYIQMHKEMTGGTNE